jgi:oligopeptide transport system ATP-binding protein
VPDRRRKRRRILLRGEPPNAFDPPSGCSFRTRCPQARDDCAAVIPEEVSLSPTHRVACLLVGEQVKASANTMIQKTAIGGDADVRA